MRCRLYPESESTDRHCSYPANQRLFPMPNITFHSLKCNDFRTTPSLYYLMKKHSIRYHSPTYSEANAHYYAMPTAPSGRSKDPFKHPNTPSKSNKSSKGISLTKNIKKSFEDFYFGVQIQQPTPPVYLQPKRPEKQVVYRPLNIVVERPRSVERRIIRTNRYQYPVEYQLTSRPVLPNVSKQSSSQTEISCSSSIQKNSGHLSTAIYSKEGKESRCQSEEILNKHQGWLTKPTSALIQSSVKQEKNKAQKQSLLILGRAPTTQSIYVSTDEIEEYICQNKARSKRDK